MTKGNVSLVDGQNRKGVECGGLPDLKGKVTGWTTAIGIPPIAVGRQTPSPKTLVITDCKSITVKADWYEVVVDLEKDPLEQIGTIIINGHKFVRNGGERE